MEEQIRRVEGASRSFGGPCESATTFSLGIRTPKFQQEAPIQTHAYHNPLSCTMVGPKSVRHGHGGHFLTVKQAKRQQSTKQSSSQAGKKPEKLNNPMRELKIQVCSPSLKIRFAYVISNSQFIETRPEHLRRRIWRQTDPRRKSA